MTFRIWRDTTLIDELITGADREIFLDNLQPGTYGIQEVIGSIPTVSTIQ